VGILRRDVDRLRRALPHWQIFEARSGSLLPLSADLHPATNSLWCRRATTSPWSIEVLLDHADGLDWVFRRSPAIRRPLSGIMRWTGDGVPYLAPEIQLLYKSKAIRPRDQADFERTVPKLDAGARQWLCTALRALTPDHVWLTACEG